MADVVGYQYAKRQGEGQKSKRFVLTEQQLWTCCIPPGGWGGYSGAELTGMIEGFRGFFRQENFGKYFFGQLNLSTDFFVVLYHLLLSGFFFSGAGGVKCRSRFVFFFFLGPTRSSLSLEIRITSPPPPGGVAAAFIFLQNVAKTKNEHEERENKKWEKNLISTLAFSVTWFQNLCFVRTFHFPIPLCSFPALCSQFSNIPVLYRHVRPRRTTAKFYVLWRT